MKMRNVLESLGSLLIITMIFACSAENRLVRENFASGNKILHVCPVHILSNQESNFDIGISEKIVDYINSREYAIASVTQSGPVANNQWLANEAKMVNVSIELFTEYVKENSFPDDNYSLYVEILKSGQNEIIRSVHYYLLDNNGEIAMRGLINSQWEEFKKVNPSTNEDCIEIFINGFEGKMQSK